MAEWPKKMWESVIDHQTGDEPGTEVIPADLGRDLYEALKNARLQAGLLHAPEVGANAIARYEREVGVPTSQGWEGELHSRFVRVAVTAGANDTTIEVEPGHDLCRGLLVRVPRTSEDFLILAIAGNTLEVQRGFHTFPDDPCVAPSPLLPQDDLLVLGYNPHADSTAEKG